MSRTASGTRPTTRGGAEAAVSVVCADGARRRVGRLRLRRLESIESIRRILEIATLDALGLDNSIARARVLIAAAMAATNLLKVGEFEERLAAVERR